MRLARANVPGKPLTGLEADTRRSDDNALLRSLGGMEDRLLAVEQSATAGTAGTPEAWMRARDLRLHSRTVLDTDTLAVRTLDAAELIVYLMGAGGTLKLHPARNTARVLPIEIRNDSSGTWQIVVDDAATEIIRQFNIDETSTSLDPGNVAYLWNKDTVYWVNL